MSEEEAFLQAMLERPDNVFLRLVFADWLEERGDSRGELLRLTHTLTQSVKIPNRPELESRLRTMLKECVQPIGPFWTNSLGMKFVWIPAGSFLMGSPASEEGRTEREPLHQVTLTRGFFMSVNLVTQRQWVCVMGNNPSEFKEEETLPVEQISWKDSQEFIEKLREKDKKSYRLPFEAEWEYACRAGTTTPFSFGATLSTDQANFAGAPDYGIGQKDVRRWKTTPVGSFPANAFGLHDMHGNVDEFCQDWYAAYPQNSVVDPTGPSEGMSCVLRGGTWGNGPAECRSAHRNRDVLDQGGFDCGLRVCFFMS